MSLAVHRTRFVGSYKLALSITYYLHDNGYKYRESLWSNPEPNTFTWHVSSPGRGVITVYHTAPEVATLLAISPLNLESYQYA